jgi:hypothetical protein
MLHDFKMKTIGWMGIVVGLTVGAWYWYSYRPLKIRQQCYQAVLQTSNFIRNYKSCIQSHGLEE